MSAEPAKKKVNLRSLDTFELLDNLLDDDRYTRDQSRRVLFERGDIALAVQSWAEKHSSREAAMLQAAWLHQGLGLSRFEFEGVTDPRIRAAAVRILADEIDPSGDSPLPWEKAFSLFKPLVNDEHPRVRLEAVRALGLIGTAPAARLALEATAHPMDRFIEYGLAETVSASAGPLMAEIQSGDWVADTAEKQKQLEFIVTAVPSAMSSQFLANLIKQAPLPRDGSGPWIELIGRAGGPAELKALHDAVAAGQFDDAATERVLVALDSAARLRKINIGRPVDTVKSLLSADRSPGVRRAAAHLAGTWKQGALLGHLRSIALESDAVDVLRMTAVDSIREVGGGGAAKLLLEIGIAQTKQSVQQRAIIALSALNADAAASPFFGWVNGLKNEDAALAAWRGILGSRGAGKKLAAKLARTELSETAISAGVRACRDGGRNEPDLLAALTKLSGMQSANVELTPERIKQLITLVESNGNPGRGESVYVRNELSCVKCHAIGGVGGRVGPDMTSIGASAPLDYIIQSLYDPSAKVKEGYHSVSVLTLDGQVVNGIEVESNDQVLVLRDIEDKLVSIPQADIDVKKPGKSLMPVGVIDRLSEAEQVDLIKFLSQLGKPGNYDATKGGVARVYEVLAGTHRVEQDLAERITSGEPTAGWKPMLSRVNGNVFGGTLAAMTQAPRHMSLVTVYLRTSVEAADDVKATLTTAGPKSAEMWIDGQRVDGSNSFTTELKKGKHQVIVRLDARDLPKVFRLSSRDVTFSTKTQDQSK